MVGMLVIFDIDGTLTRTYSLDTDLFSRMFHELHGWRLHTDWSHYRHATDRGIAEEALAHCLGRQATSAEIRLVRTRYLDLLGFELAYDPPRHQVPGAAAAIDELIRGGYGIAFATGCWKSAAAIKLARAGIDIAGLPLATCDDNIDRLEILRLARERVRATRPFEPAVYVGDGPWDLAAARELGISFVGVVCDGSARLGSSGVKNILDDFHDLDSVLKALRNAVDRAI